MTNTIEIGEFHGYHVSTSGEVYSVKSGRPKLLKPRIDKSGYKSVTLWLGRNRVKKQCRVHRLVAMAFIPNTQSYSDVNHKDNDKLNNDISNLEWCTRAYNNQYSGHKKRVIDTSTGQEFESVNEAATASLINRSYLSAMLSGNSTNTTSLKYK